MAAIEPVDDVRMFQRVSVVPSELHHAVLLADVRRVETPSADSADPVGDVSDAPVQLSARDEDEFVVMFQRALARYEAARAARQRAMTARVVSVREAR